MERIRNIIIDLDKENCLKKTVAKAVGWKESDIASFYIVKRSIDARKRNNIKLVFTVDISKRKEQRDIHQIKQLKTSMEYPPIVVGFGPSGMFAAHTLAVAGAAPIVLERGDDVDSRREKVNTFWGNGILDSNSNVQFGEGGAGAFSDGKLTTQTNDNERQLYILSNMVDFGANKEIIYDSKPHIGTDKLSVLVKNLRNDIIAKGGTVKFNAKVSDIVLCNDGVRVIADKEYFTKHLILATGHSARDMYRLLYEKGFAMQAKPFAIGARIEHLQKDINEALYGKYANHPALRAADYKLVRHTSNGGVYSFCMCPGGYVIASSSEEGEIVTNGMSYADRSGVNANAAILKGVTAKDYGDNLFDGVEYQRALERKAYELGGGSYYAPCQLLGDFFKGRKSSAFGEINPTYRPGTNFARLDKLLGESITAAFREAFVEFSKSIEGYDDYKAVLTGVETRSSSPIRILRGENYRSITSPFVYPCGEGAGYAGGIMSAAVDGMKVAESIVLQ